MPLTTQDKDAVKISANEMSIILTLRELKPFEHIEIHADKLGKLNNYVVHRKYLVPLTNESTIGVI